ncbi:hypothetical protein LX36DRAFT_276435 [Colletotrichum falcatum]|nr:hypothetical protein LX36DRAFT_276435 [Colletotrichum falcatum]
MRPVHAPSRRHGHYPQASLNDPGIAGHFLIREPGKDGHHEKTTSTNQADVSSPLSGVGKRPCDDPGELPTSVAYTNYHSPTYTSPPSSSSSSSLSSLSSLSSCYLPPPLSSPYGCPGGLQNRTDQGRVRHSA